MIVVAAGAVEVSLEAVVAWLDLTTTSTRLLSCLGPRSNPLNGTQRLPACILSPNPHVAVLKGVLGLTLQFTRRKSSCSALLSLTLCEPVLPRVAFPLYDSRTRQTSPCANDQYCAAAGGLVTKNSDLQRKLLQKREVSRLRVYKQNQRSHRVLPSLNPKCPQVLHDLIRKTKNKDNSNNEKK